MLTAPERIRAHIRALHRSSRPIDDAEIDALLGIRPRESRLDPIELIFEHGPGLIDGYGATPYETVREVIQRLSPRRGDVFYDLGCGYGRVVMWGALVSGARFRGIEVVPQRLRPAQRAKERLGLANLELRQANVLSSRFDDGNLFFLFDPFFTDHLRRVGHALARIARHHPIRIASLWQSNDYFRRRRWLHEVRDEAPTDDPYGLRFFASTKE
jgi:SAM-dependent methyltransferase